MTDPTALPDRTDPDQVPVHIAIARVMDQVRVVAKDDENKQRRFNFRGIDAVLNAVGPALRDHGVLVLPKVLEQQRDYYTRSGGGKMHHVVVRVQYTFIGPKGDRLEVEVPGEGADLGDKAYSKAMSVALRTALIQSLALPTGEQDPDAEIHDRADDEQPMPDASTDTAAGPAAIPQALTGPKRGTRAQPAAKTPTEDADEVRHAIAAILAATTVDEARAQRDAIRSGSYHSANVAELLADQPELLAELKLTGPRITLLKFAATYWNHWDQTGHTALAA